MKTPLGNLTITETDTVDLKMFTVKLSGKTLCDIGYNLTIKKYFLDVDINKSDKADKRLHITRSVNSLAQELNLETKEEEVFIFKITGLTRKEALEKLQKEIENELEEDEL